MPETNSKTDDQIPLGFSAHDHKACAHSFLVHAESICRDRGVRMTPVRRCALEILLESHRAMGAYDVLARLDEAGFGAKPPVAYRALGFLVEQGFAHRVERLNAFIACSGPHGPHDPAFMICRDCGHVAEIESFAAVGQRAQQIGFTIESAVIEVEGTCPDCSPAAQAASTECC